MQARVQTYRLSTANELADEVAYSLGEDVAPNDQTARTIAAGWASDTTPALTALAAGKDFDTEALRIEIQESIGEFDHQTALSTWLENLESELSS